VSKRRASYSDVLAALVLVFAACCAALISHVGIDVAGDYLLAHDAYDGLDHRSRSEILALGLTLALGAILRVVSRAVRAAGAGGSGDDRAELLALVGCSPWRFALRVMALSIVALAAMEAVDVWSSGGAIDDVADLFGGSLLLGSSITLPVAGACALGVRFLVRLAIVSQHSLAAALGRLIALITRNGTTEKRRFERRSAGAWRYRSILARRGGKRGPPLFASRHATSAVRFRGSVARPIARDSLRDFFGERTCICWRGSSLRLPFCSDCRSARMPPPAPLR
jgi:hypothetical protein